MHRGEGLPEGVIESLGMPGLFFLRHDVDEQVGPAPQASLLDYE
jgi:hypothetical protein